VTTYLEGDNVVLGIHDQGNGIDEEILEKLGTPFFTTKVDGTGMGLVICYRIAERHHAAITIDTSQNGTSFLVKFRASTGTYQ
jgi:signal transduction histidine kinase